MQCNNTRVLFRQPFLLFANKGMQKDDSHSLYTTFLFFNGVFTQFCILQNTQCTTYS